MTIHKSKGLEFPVVIMPLQRKTIVGNLKINYGLMGRNGFWSAKVIVDNSSAVEGLWC
jgi:ATP-dependent exoDNAse (exonuclease V) beta subunit